MIVLGVQLYCTLVKHSRYDVLSPVSMVTAPIYPGYINFMNIYPDVDIPPMWLIIIWQDNGQHGQ